MNSPRHDLKNFLEYKAYKLRQESLLMTSIAGSGHPTSCLSAADLVAALFFYAMRYELHNPENPDNDRFILSKGHASPLLYASWKEAGALTDKDLLGYRTLQSPLEGHPTRRFTYAEAATGSLGMGLSIGAGMAYAAKMDKRTYTTYVLLGDSELAEGSIWEAAEIAAFYKLDSLVALVDCNRLGQSTETMHGHHYQRIAEKFTAFGWHTLHVDGHDMQQIMAALDKTRERAGRPFVIIAKTIKGYGIEQVEDKQGFHGKAFPKKDLDMLNQELAARFPEAAAYHDDGTWQPPMPEKQEIAPLKPCIGPSIKHARYEKGSAVATRKAYGQALADLGAVCPTVISLDAEVKNSTYADIFEAKFPERFIQCFIAEQNMVSMGVGLERRSKIPFISTFGAFFSRCFDQVRMAAIGTSALRLVGSHAGVSIGQDGPSQMALEDIALMRTLPGSCVVYPCDGVSTHKLVAEIAEYNQGISYLRTTRMDTPVIYGLEEEFPIGGCKILRQSAKDVACVVGAGVTLFEALKAHEALENEGIAIAVIDLYSVKPLDHATLEKVGLVSGKRIITVEDHYRAGGIGEAVTYALRNTEITIECLAVKELPHSGKPEELLAWAGIDAAAIVKAVKATKK